MRALSSSVLPPTPASSSSSSASSNSALDLLSQIPERAPSSGPLGDAEATAREIQQEEVKEAETLIKDALGPGGPQRRHVLYFLLKLALGSWLLSQIAFWLYKWTSTSKEVSYIAWKTWTLSELLS